MNVCRIVPRIVVFRDHLLALSEAFVLSQGEAFRQFEPVYVGSRRRPGVDTPPARTLVVNDGGWRGRVAEGLFKTLGLAPRLIRDLRRIGPLLLHAHFGTDGVLALPLARSLSVPLVVTFHGFDATATDEHARRSFYVHRKLLRRRKRLQETSDLFLAVSGFVRQKLLDKGFPADRTVVHYLGVDLSSFRADAAVSREPFVLFVGRLAEEKGVSDLLRAMSSVHAEKPDARVVLIGDGPLRAGLEREAVALSGRARFLGSQPPCLVRSWLNRAQVFSVPSVRLLSGEEEGFGLAFVEGQAMGVPVVSYRTGGIPEAVADGVTGLLAPPGDVEALGANIRNLLVNPGLRAQLGEAGRRRVEELFDIEKQTAKLEGIYERLVQAPKCTPAAEVAHARP